MNSTVLVPVFTGELNGQTVQLVNARDLHAFLEVGRDFSNWIKQRLKRGGFVPKRDYIEVFPQTGGNPQNVCSPNRGSKETVCSPNLASKGRGGHNVIDYHLILETAKHICMMEQNDKGHEVRDYFIECERRLREGGPAPKALPEPLPEAVQTAINHRVFLIAADALREAVEVLTAIAREHLAQGHSIAETVELVAHTPLHRMGLVRRDDLRPIAGLLSELLVAVNALIEGRPMPEGGRPG